MIRRASRAVVLAALVVASTAVGAEPFEYLYVESNVGGSSGGHAAVRLGERVFHYMNADDGSLRLLRESFETFRYSYSVLENRTIHIGRIDVSDASFDRIHDRFNRRYLIEQQHFDALASQRADAALLEQILDRGNVPDPGERLRYALRIPGAGFFAADDSAPGAASPTLVRLRERIESTYGAEALQQRLIASREALFALRPNATPDLRSHPHPSRDRLPLDEYAFSRRFADLACARAALEIVLDARPLRPDAIRSDTSADWNLTDNERVALRAFADRQEERLVELFGSDREDWGYAALVGTARLAVLAESLATGRWVVLDAFPEETRVITDVTHPGRSEFFGELQRYSRSDFFGSRGAFLAAHEVGEREYNEVEVAANRALEVREGLASARDIRVYGGRLAPRGEWSPPDSWLPQMDREEGESALRISRDRASSNERALRGLYAYELIENNCVSALFETVESAFEDGEVTERLGGRVQTKGTLNFIPWVSFDAVTREYRVAEVGEIPSLRMTRLATMYENENRAKVYLRESNTLTSSVYRSNPHDSFFVFFTDDVVLPRPLYGAFNFLAGIGQATLGLLRMPFIGPEEFIAGAKGAFFSLPELFFVNLRKGSLDYGPSFVARTGRESSGRTN